MVKKFRALGTTICRVIKKLKGLFRIALVSSLATIKHMCVQFHTGAFLKIVLYACKYIPLMGMYMYECNGNTILYIQYTSVLQNNTIEKFPQTIFCVRHVIHDTCNFYLQATPPVYGSRLLLYMTRREVTNNCFKMIKTQS
jgi:hypothetical protein